MKNTYTAYKNLLQELEVEFKNYDNRPTKACSARIRKFSNELGKLGVDLRKEMIQRDKEA